MLCHTCSGNKELLPASIRHNRQLIFSSFRARGKSMFYMTRPVRRGLALSSRKLPLGEQADETQSMNTRIQLFLRLAAPAVALAVLAAVPQADAVDGLLLQDTYVDTAKATINYGSSGDLRVFKSTTGSMRAFLKFSTATLPTGTTSAA